MWQDTAETTRATVSGLFQSFAMLFLWENVPSALLLHIVDHQMPDSPDNSLHGDQSPSDTPVMLLLIDQLIQNI